MPSCYIISSQRHGDFHENIEFDFTVTLKIYENDDKDYLINKLLQGMKLLELDSLGSSGSRGYGKVKFELADQKFQDIMVKFDHETTAVFDNK